MDAVALLHRAQEAGLHIEPKGDRLLVRGPKRAEAVVKLLAEHKAEVLAALSPSIGSWWRERFAAKAVQWFVGDRDWEAAKRLAWGDLENEWHHQHGKRRPSWQCAGCDAPIGGSQALNLPDGNRVHLEPIDCLIRFGKRWRGDASDALVAFGLEPPGLGGDQLGPRSRTCRGPLWREQAQSNNGVVKMSKTVPHVMTHREQWVIQCVTQFKPRDGRSAAEAQAFLEGRLKEAERIDPQTCEYWYAYADIVDPYNIFEDDEVLGHSEKGYFVRNVPDGDWVWYGDLPEHIFKALIERINREADTYENYLKRPKESRQLWEAKYELRRRLREYSDVSGAACAHELRAYLREWEERHPDQLHPRTGDRTIVVLFDLVNAMLDILQPDNKAAEHT
jgi:hypothetical protein